MASMNMNSYSPVQTIEMVSRTGVYKGNMRLDKVFFSAVRAFSLRPESCARLAIRMGYSAGNSMHGVMYAYDVPYSEAKRIVLESCEKT